MLLSKFSQSAEVSLARDSCWVCFSASSTLTFSYSVRYWRILSLLSWISFCSVSCCALLFSFTRLKLSRLACSELIFELSSVSLDFNSPILICTFRTSLPPASKPSPLSLRQSPSISWRRLRRRSRSSRSLSTRVPKRRMKTVRLRMQNSEPEHAPRSEVAYWSARLCSSSTAGRSGFAI